MGDICSSFDCIVNADLSPHTKKVYLERLRFIMEERKTDLEKVLLKPTEVMEWIQQHTKTPQTQKSYISAILAVYKHTPGLKDKYRDTYYQWYLEFKKLHDQIDARYKQNQPSEKQREAFVQFKDIVAKRDTLPKGSKERLLLALYTYLPPLRSDFNKVFLYQKAPKSFDHENYMKLYDIPMLVLHEYKTSKKKDVYEKELPPELVEEIKASLEKGPPRDWLFVDRSKQPYVSGSFTKWANRMLKKLFGRALTISLIRHSYINTLDFNRLTVQEKEDIARDMAHTVGTQDKYRLIFN